MLNRIIHFFMNKRLIVYFLLFIIIVSGIVYSPFDWETDIIPRDPVPVDAIPDIGENQQIVFTMWNGRSPQDIEDQITYPLTTALLGIPKVKTVRSSSMFGFSSIYVIFEEDADFYWSRSRILERLSSLSEGILPQGVKPSLGPDATALGQIFWYTLEATDENGNKAPWDVDDLRRIQDFYVRFQLMSAHGVSEVSSIGGYVKEYQIDIDPDKMIYYGVSLEDIANAVKKSNSEAGARTIEINKVEYILRGLGYIKEISDIEKSVIKTKDNTPVYVRDVANVSFGPALRRGALDKNGEDAVGGIVVARFGENPLKVIKNVKEKIRELESGLPSRTLEDGTKIKVRLVPFYDRTGLINETLDTLSSALTEEILVTILVIVFMVMNLRSSILISFLLPVSILMCFSAMKFFKVDANIVALSGIVIAIGTMVDMGIVLTENILKRIKKEENDNETLFKKVYDGVSEVSGAVLTALSTTIIGFIPVFVLTGAEGKLFKPLAFTKTFALISSAIVSFLFIPAFFYLFFKKNDINIFSEIRVRLQNSKIIKKINTDYFNYSVIFFVSVFLSLKWRPLGIEKGIFSNYLFTLFIVSSFLGFFRLFEIKYETILRWALSHKKKFLLIPFFLILSGAVIWIGFNNVFFWIPDFVRLSKPAVYVSHKFPGLGKEFMPFLDEGAYLYMPVSMSHASITAVSDAVKVQDSRISSIPEVSEAVGKLGRAESAIDPAPISMIETLINYKDEYLKDKDGNVLFFKFDSKEKDYFRDKAGNPLKAPDGEEYYVKGKFIRDEDGSLIPDRNGKPFRLWRKELSPSLNEGREYWKGIKGPSDIWDEIVKAADYPGITKAPVLQPISTRIVMLQTGMRAPMGVKIKGPDLESIEKAGKEIEKILKDISGIRKDTVSADNIISKPYIEIKPDREKMAFYGIRIGELNNIIETAIGGRSVSFSVEGRERYSIRVRFMRDYRDNLESIERIFIKTPSGDNIMLSQIADISFSAGPSAIKSEDGFLTGYILFDKQNNVSEVEAVRMAEKTLKERIKTGDLDLPEGVSYRFSGTYENQVRAEQKFRFIIPFTLILIFFIIYGEFDSIVSTLLVFSSILIAWSGGFIMVWLYGQESFMNFSISGINLRDLFQIGNINLSVAVWVGFMALFGIASDDGVMIGTFLKNTFKESVYENIEDIREITVKASLKRLKACLMTSATTILALLPVLTSTGRGSDIMVPMAIPSFGGMFVVMISIISVPVMYCSYKEFSFRKR